MENVRPAGRNSWLEKAVPTGLIPAPDPMILRLLLLLLPVAVLAATPTLDDLVLGNAASETEHHLVGVKSEVVQGALKLPARRLLPGGEQPWEGGRLSFTMKVDPKEPNYVTARFWGDEVDKNFLVLFCEGKQVGYRFLGDVDVLALPDDEPRYNGRFYYSTTPLPRALTAGKTEVHLDITAMGRSGAMRKRSRTIKSR